MKNLEVIILNEVDAINAQAVGATRLELVSAMEVGGLSPTLETVQKVIDNVSIPVNVMVRFNSSFKIDEHQLNLKINYINELKKIGVNGIVFGSLTADDKVDIEQLKKIKQAAGNLQITYHRAIDTIPAFEQQVAILNASNLITNILTSGGIENPIEKNIEQLKLVSTQNSKIQILLGGGITKNNLQTLVNNLPTADIHIGSFAYNNNDFTQGINSENIRYAKQIIETNMNGEK